MCVYDKYDICINIFVTSIYITELFIDYLRRPFSNFKPIQDSFNIYFTVDFMGILFL